MLHTRLAALSVAALLAGCVYIPRTKIAYNECGMESKRKVLQLEQVGIMAGCANEACIGLLAAAGVVTAASAVVSGSIVVAGNIVYWLERKGACAQS